MPGLSSIVEGRINHGKSSPQDRAFQPRAFSELVQTGSNISSGFFLKKKPPFTALKTIPCIPKMQ
jgi:hypothetical protein